MYQSRFTAGYASKQRTRNSIIIIYSKAVAMIRMAAIRIIIINQCCFYFGRRRFYLYQGGCTASLAQPTPIKPPPHGICPLLLPSRLFLTSLLNCPNRPRSLCRCFSPVQASPSAAPKLNVPFVFVINGSCACVCKKHLCLQETPAPLLPVSSCEHGALPQCCGCELSSATLGLT